MTLPDQAARERIRDDLDATLVVEAAAAGPHEARDARDPTAHLACAAGALESAAW